jgi:hypothetical protein
MNGNNASCTANLNNNSGATLSLTNTNTGTNGAAIRASLTPVNLITNAGTLSLSTALATSMLFGDNSSTLNNTGTVTVDKALTGFAANATAGIINNNAGGVFNFDVATSATAAIINTNKILFKNNGGTVKGRGVFSTGTFTNTGALASGYIDPGIGSGIGTFTISETPFTLTGTCLMKVNNPTTAGTDYDQIIGGGTLNLTGATITATVGYTPTLGDLITLFSAQTISGAITLTPMTNWSISYVTDAAKMLYSEVAATYAIAATVDGGSVTGTGIITAGETATLTASKAGYTFVNWTESGSVVSTSNPYSFTVAGPRTLVANYIHEISWDGGAADGLWTSAANWSSDATPIATDIVTIPAGYIVTVSSDAGKINKLTVLGKLIIDAAGTLVVEQGTAFGTSIVEVGGGEIDNAGSFTINQLLSSSSAGLSLANGTDADAKFNNTGFLTINVAFGSSTGACVRFNQTTASRTAQMILGGTVNLSNNTGQHYFNVLAGQASIDGTAVFGSVSDYRNNKLIHIVDGTLTLASGANITYYSGFVNTEGAVTIANATSGGLTNNGSLTIHNGSAVTGSAIYMYPQASATATLTNAGTITIDGVSPVGQLNISGLNATSTATLNNQTGATLSITNTHASASTILASATPTVALTNNGTISLTVPTSSRAMYFGGLNATFTNNGTLNSVGAITGNDATNASVFTNSSTGIFNANNVLDTYVAISNNKKFTFNNHGLITGKGIFGSGTLNTLDGTLSPGIAGGIGLFRVYQNPYVLTGKYIMQVNGTAVAGTDYDQILVSSTPAPAIPIVGSFSIDPTASLEVTVGGGYTPVLVDQVALFLGGLSRTGDAFTLANVTAPANWIMAYGATNASAAFANPLVSLSTASLFDFNYALRYSSGPSTEQSFTISGTELVGSVTLTPPADYEISTGTAALFIPESPITLTPTSGTLSSTTIYVRMKAGLTTNTYIGNITIASSGTTSQTLALSGNVQENVTGLWDANSSFTVSAINNNLKVSGVEAGSIIDIYNGIGKKLISRNAINGVNLFPMQTKGLLIVKVGSKTTKIVL